MTTQPLAAAAPPFYVQRMWLFFAGYFLFGGVTLPFFPVWLESRGLTDVEIAQVIAIPWFVRVFLTPFAGIYADRAPNRRFAVITFTLPAAIIFLFAWPATGFWPLLFVTGLSFMIWGLALPPAEALALTGVRRFGLDYGRMRTGGSFAFIAANLSAGALLGFFDREAIYFFILFTMVTSVLVSFALPVTPPEVRALDNAARPDTRPSREVLGNAAFIMLMIGVALVQASHALLYGFGAIEWTRLGYSGFDIGILWAFSIACEIALFIFAKQALARVSAYSILLVGAVATVVRWVLFPFVPPLGFAGFALLQCLHALTFGATYLGTQQLIARLVPERMTASAQGILAMATGGLMAIATSLSGPIYHSFGIYGFLLMVPIAGAGLLMLLAIGRYARG
jgi:MFS transporter, PPP family, 3-phenylpropionic acid transporter